MAFSRAVPVVLVADVPDAAGRWARVLGAEVVMDHGWIATIGTAGGPQLSVMSADATSPVPPQLSVEVDDLEAALARARAEGLEVVHGPADESWGVRRFLVRDRDGVVLNVLQHRA